MWPQTNKLGWNRGKRHQVSDHVKKNVDPGFHGNGYCFTVMGVVAMVMLQVSMVTISDYTSSSSDSSSNFSRSDGMALGTPISGMAMLTFFPSPPPSKGTKKLPTDLYFPPVLLDLPLQYCPSWQQQTQAVTRVSPSTTASNIKISSSRKGWLPMKLPWSSPSPSQVVVEVRFAQRLWGSLLGTISVLSDVAVLSDVVVLSDVSWKKTITENYCLKKAGSRAHLH